MDYKTLDAKRRADLAYAIEHSRAEYRRYFVRSLIETGTIIFAIGVLIYAICFWL